MAKKRLGHQSGSKDAKKAKCDVSSSTDTSSSRETSTSISSVTTTTTESDTSHEHIGGTSPSRSLDRMGDTPREQHEDKSPDGGSRDVPPSRPGGTAEGDVCNLSGTSCRQMVIDDSDDGRNVRSVYRRSDCAEMHVWTQYGPSVKRKMPTENEELASSQCDLLFDTTGKQVASVAYFHQIFYLVVF